MNIYEENNKQNIKQFVFFAPATKIQIMCVKSSPKTGSLMVSCLCKLFSLGRLHYFPACFIYRSTDGGLFLLFYFVYVLQNLYGCRSFKSVQDSKCFTVFFILDTNRCLFTSQLIKGIVLTCCQLGEKIETTLVSVC